MIEKEELQVGILKLQYSGVSKIQIYNNGVNINVKQQYANQLDKELIK